MLLQKQASRFFLTIIYQNWSIFSLVFPRTEEIQVCIFRYSHFSIGIWFWKIEVLYGSMKLGIVWIITNTLTRRYNKSY